MIQECKNSIVEDDFHEFLHRNCEGTEQLRKNDCFAKNWAVDFGGYIPVISYTHIDDTWEKCYGYTKGMKENVGYSGSSPAKGNDAVREKKEGQKEQLEKYLEKRARMKEFQQKTLKEKLAKEEFERLRLTKAWSSRRQMAAVSGASSPAGGSFDIRA